MSLEHARNSGFLENHYKGIPKGGQDLSIFFQTYHELAYAVIALMFFVRFQNIELSTLLEVKTLVKKLSSELIYLDSSLK